MTKLIIVACINGFFTLIVLCFFKKFTKIWDMLAPRKTRNVLRTNEIINDEKIEFRNMKLGRFFSIGYILSFLMRIEYLFVGIVVFFLLVDASYLYSWDAKIGFENNKGIIKVFSQTEIPSSLEISSVYWGSRFDKEVWVNLSPYDIMHGSCPRELVHSQLVRMLLDMDLLLKKDVSSILYGEFDFDRIDSVDKSRVYLVVDRVNLVSFRMSVLVTGAKIHAELDGFSSLDSVVRKKLQSKLTYLVNHSDRYKILRQAIAGWALGRILKKRFGSKLRFVFGNVNNFPSQWKLIEKYLSFWRDESLIVGGIYGLTDSIIKINKGYIQGDKVFANGVILDGLSYVLLSSFERLPVIVSDVDGTLLNDNPISESMAEAIFSFLKVGGKFIVLTGSSLDVIERRVVFPLIKIAKAQDKMSLLENVFILSDSGIIGSKLLSTGRFESLYDIDYVNKYREQIISVIELIMHQENIPIRLGETLIIKDRIVVLCPWGRPKGKDREKLIDSLGEDSLLYRRKLVTVLNNKFVKYGLRVEARIAGSLSIDITVKGGKQVGFDKIKELLSINPKEEVIYLGDCFFKGGNDEPVIERAKLCIDVVGKRRDGTVFTMSSGVDSSYEVIKRLVDLFSGENWHTYCHALLNDLLQKGKIIEVLRFLARLPSSARLVLVNSILSDLEGFLETWMERKSHIVETYLGDFEKDRLENRPIAILGGGSGTSKLWPYVFSKIGLRAEDVLTFVHNLDDGGSSLEIMERMELKGLDFPFPLGDAAGMLFGWTKGLLCDLFQDSMRIKTDRLLREVFLKLVEFVSNGKEDFDEEEILWVLSMMDVLQRLNKEYVSILPDKQVSVRNAMIWGMYLWAKYVLEKENVDINLALDMVSDILNIKLGVRYLDNNKRALFLRRQGWTIRLVDGKDVTWVGIFREEKEWKYKVIRNGEIYIGTLQDGDNFLLDGYLKVSVVGGRVTLADKIELKQSGFNATVTVDRKKIPLAIDGSGRIRVAQVTGDDLPVTTMGNIKVYISPDITVMQTNITETFSPLIPIEYGLLNLRSKISYDVYRNATEELRIENVVGTGISLKGKKLVIIGPGSFLTSIAPYFAFKNFVDEISKVKANGGMVVLCFGAMIDNECFGMSVMDCVKMLEKISGRRITSLVDIIVVPEGDIIPDLSIFQTEFVKYIVGNNRSVFAVSVSGKLGYGKFGLSKMEEELLQKSGLNIVRIRTKKVRILGRNGLKVSKIVYDPEDMLEKMSLIVRKSIAGGDEVLSASKKEKRIGTFLDDLIHSVRNSSGIDSGLVLLKEVLNNPVISANDLDLWQDVFRWVDDRNMGQISSFLKEFDCECLYGVQEIKDALLLFDDIFKENFSTKIVCLGMILSELGAIDFVKKLFSSIVNMPNFRLEDIDKDVVISVSKRLFSLSKSDERSAGGIKVVAEI